MFFITVFLVFREEMISFEARELARDCLFPRAARTFPRPLSLSYAVQVLANIVWAARLVSFSGGRFETQNCFLERSQLFAMMPKQ